MTDAASDSDRGKLIDLGSIELWVDVQGPADGDAVLLLAGADTPGFRWTPASVMPLVADGHRVIRFDHRDCGRSTACSAADPYLLADMAADVIALLDHLGIDGAHLIGRSMGGMIAQVLALEHGRRVRSLTLLGTTPGAGDERLPGPDEPFVETMMTRLFQGPPVEIEDQAEWIAELAELLAGTLYPYDRDGEVRLAQAEVRTGWVAESGHGVAVHSSPSRLDHLDEIGVPTLIVHGSVDPVFPLAHGRALAEGIPGAVYVEVDGLGHEVPDSLIAELWPVVRRHLIEAAAWS